MADDVAEALNAFRAYAEPRDGLGDNTFKLACSFDEPATPLPSRYCSDRVPGRRIETGIHLGGQEMDRGIRSGMERGRRLRRRAQRR